MTISHVRNGYKDVDIKFSPTGAPHIYPKALSQETYRNLVLKNRLPLEIIMTGENLGHTKLTSGYSEADIGAYSRKIVKQIIGLSLTKRHFIFNLNILTTPVDPASVYGQMTDEHRSSQEYTFEFQFPLDVVPEILNLTQREIGVFEKLIEKVRA